MASLTNTNALKYRHMGQDVDSLPKFKTISLRDKILKEFIKKQLRTSETLEAHCQSRKDFISASVEESLTASTSGLSSAEDFKHLQDLLVFKQVLKSSGLTDDEVQVLLCEKDKILHPSSSFQKSKLEAIQDKLEKRQKWLDELAEQEENFSGAVPLNRHEFEEEINCVPSSEKADKLTACLVRLQPHKDDTVPVDHPINHIKQIAEELFPPESKPTSTVNESKRKSDWKVDDRHSGKVFKTENKILYMTEKPKTLWDMDKIPKLIATDKVLQSEQTCSKREKAITDTGRMVITKKETLVKHDRSRPFVLTLVPSDLIPLSFIEANRETIEKLRSMDKFRDWREGEPSETLYIKNLSSKVTPNDLASLMGNFESADGRNIAYRILNGRMKGQAFVTFPDKILAERALKTCNGFILYDKPIIIEYGKQ